MGAAGPLNPKGRRIAKDPSGQIFWSLSGREEPAQRAGKKPARDGFGRAGPAHRSHARAGNGPAIHPEIAMPKMDRQRATERRRKGYRKTRNRDDGRSGTPPRPDNRAATTRRRAPKCALCKSETWARYGPRFCRVNSTSGTRHVALGRGARQDRNGVIAGRTNRPIADIRAFAARA